MQKPARGRAGSLLLRSAGQLDRFVEHWFGWSLPPVQRAIECTGWAPDVPQVYCRRCGDSIAQGEATADGCGTCREGSELAGGIGDGVIRLGPYAGALREWVLAIKFQQWSEMGDRLGALLGQRLGDAEAVDLTRVVVAPMPMPWLRRLYRGIDHARVIAAGVAREINAPLTSIITRKNLPPQVSLTPSDRRRSGLRGFRIKRRFERRWMRGQLQDLDIVLVDDVRTTGASLKGAAKLIRRLKPRKVICAVVAVSDSTARLKRGPMPPAAIAGAGEMSDGRA